MTHQSLLNHFTSTLVVAVALGCGSFRTEMGAGSGPGGSPAQGGSGGHTGQGGDETGGVAGQGGAAGAPNQGGAAGGGDDIEQGGFGGAPSWTWATVADLPEPRQSAGCVSSADALYVLGGMKLGGGAGDILDSVVRYDPGTDAWSERAPLPTPRCCFATARLGATIYVAGGYDPGNEPSSAFYAYDLATDAWSTRPDMPTARALASAVVWGNKLAVIGGRPGNQEVTGVVELFDPATNSWGTSPVEEPTPRENAAVVYGDFGLVVAGGYPSASFFGTNEVDVYHSGAWSDGPSMLLPRGQLAWGMLAGRLVLAGGWDTDFVEAWLPGSPSWEELPALSSKRAGACAARVDHALYVVGGGDYVGAGVWESKAVVEVLRAF